LAAIENKHRFHQCIFGENRSRNATVRVHTDGYTDTLTDANRFLANVNCSRSRSRSLYVVVRPSVCSL